MALYRCNHCGHIEETPSPPQQTTCAACGKPVTAHDAATLLRYVMQRYTELKRQFKALQQTSTAAPSTTESSTEQPANKPTSSRPAAKAKNTPPAPKAAAPKRKAPAAATPGPQPTHKQVLHTKFARELAAAQNAQPIQTSPSAASAVDLRNAALHTTSALATNEQHKPLRDWFSKHGMKTVTYTSNVDMSGFFDEAAEAIGNNYQLMAPVIEQIRHAYMRNSKGIQLNLKKYSHEKANRLITMCRNLHEWTMLSHSTYRKSDKTLHLGLQNATVALKFLCGGWLEWFALGVALAEIKKKQGAQSSYAFSVARGLTLEYADGGENELDVAVLPHSKNQPIIIECKSGEFRSDIDKMVRLTRRLSLQQEHFIVLAADLSEKQTKALSAMYPLRFLTLQRLHEHLATLL